MDGNFVVQMTETDTLFQFISNESSSAAVAAAAVLTNWNGWQQTSKKLSAHELINFNAFLSAYKMDQFLLYTSSHLLSTWITLRLYGFKRNKG